MKQEIKEILDEFEKKGSNITSREEIEIKTNNILSKEQTLSEALHHVALDVIADTEYFMDSKSIYGDNFISGTSTMIYLPSLDNLGEYKLKIIAGNKNRFSEDKIDEETLFDVASITKLFTLILCLKLEELGLINLDDKISNINPKYKSLGDFTFNDLIRLHGEICTQGRIDNAESKEEAYSLLATSYLKSNDRTKNKYTDIGALIIGDTISKVISEKLGKKMTYSDVMNEFLFKQIGINHNVFNPSTNNVSGNGRSDNLVHDPKSRILGGNTAHAGMFINSNDLCLLSKSIMGNGYLSETSKSRLGEITFPFSPKGNLGIFVKTEDGLLSSYTPEYYSTGSYSHQGWTGSITSFDPNNQIHQHILVNAILDSKDKLRTFNDKPIGYKQTIRYYQLKLTKNAFISKLIKEYYNRCLNVNENIETTLKLK